MNKQYTLWCTYHDEKLLKKYNLINDDHYLKLFNNDKYLEEDNINYLHDYLGDLATYYYIWKNNLKSDIVGFDQYGKHFSYIDYNMINNYGFFPFNGGYFTDITNLKYLFEKYNHFYFLFIQYMKIKYNINLLNLFKKDKNFLLFFHNMYFFKWDMFCDVCDFIFGFLEYIFPNEQWKIKNNIKLLNNLRHNPINEEILEENSYGWDRHLSVFYEYLIGFYLGLKIHNDYDKKYKIHGLYSSYFIKCKNMFNNLDDLLKWLNLNMKSGIINFIVIANNIDIEVWEIVNTYVYNLIICKNEIDFNIQCNLLKNNYLKEFELRSNEYINCINGIEMHNGNYTIEKFDNIN